MFGVFWVTFVFWLMGVNVLTYIGMKAAWRDAVENDGYQRSFFQYRTWDHDNGGELALRPFSSLQRYLLDTDVGLRRLRIWSWMMPGLFTLILFVVL